MEVWTHQFSQAFFEKLLLETTDHFASTAQAMEQLEAIRAEFASPGGELVLLHICRDVFAGEILGICDLIKNIPKPSPYQADMNIHIGQATRELVDHLGTFLYTMSEAQRQEKLMTIRIGRN